MPQTTFTYAEVKAMLDGEMAEELQAKVDEAGIFEKSKALRQSVIDTITNNATETITNILTPLVIPNGVGEIALIYDLSPETCDFIIKPAGVSVKMIAEGAVSDDVIRLVSAAEYAANEAEKKNPQPLAFIRKTLGDGAMQQITSFRDFGDNVKPELDSLYTNVKAAKLSEGISEIPAGDKCRLSIKYSSVVDAEGKKQAGWLAPNVTCGKTVSGSRSTGVSGTRRPTVKPPEPYKSWEAYAAARHDDQSSKAQDIFDAQIKKWGADWKSHISPTNALRNAKHEFFMQRQAEVYAEHGTDW